MYLFRMLIAIQLTGLTIVEYTFNSTNIRSEIITGIYGNPIEEIKASDIFFHFRRGDGLDSNSLSKSYSYVQYRKNLNNSWSNQYKIDNGLGGQSILNNNKIQLGNYYAIQYRIIHTDDAPMVLYGIYEDIKDVGI